MELARAPESARPNGWESLVRYPSQYQAIRAASEFSEESVSRGVGLANRGVKRGQGARTRTRTRDAIRSEGVAFVPGSQTSS